MLLQSFLKKGLQFQKQKRRLLQPRDIVLGGIWLGPGSGTSKNGNGTHPDLGQDNAHAVIQAALDAGIVEVDTAPWYGAGSAEERLGKALRSVVQAAAVPNEQKQNSRNSSMKVGTKAGRLFYESDGTTPALSGFDAPGVHPLDTRICINDYTARGARTSLEHSLHRMGLDRVDVLRIHDPNDNSNNSHFSMKEENFVDEVEIALDEELGMLKELRALRDIDGAIGEIGVGMNTNVEEHMGAPDQVLRLLRRAPARTFDSALLAGGWNLLSQTGWECLLECQRRDIPVYNAGVFASGFLASNKKPYAYVDEVSSQRLSQRKKWLELAHDGGYSLPAVAIAFAALPTIVTKLVIGAATPSELQQMLEWVEESNTIPESLWECAADQGLFGEVE